MSLKHMIKLIPARIRWIRANGRNIKNFQPDYRAIHRDYLNKFERLIIAQRVSPYLKQTYILEGEVKQLKEILERYGNR